MSHFVPCPACSRHVLTQEAACPFCAVVLPESVRAQQPPPARQGRLSRALMVAASATLLGACSNDTSVPVYGAPAGDGGLSDAGPGDMDTGGPVPIYGAAPLSAPPADDPESK
jgi:hypothetical protein